MYVLLCVSASHKTASFELLERLSVPSTPVAPLITEHGECVQGNFWIAGLQQIIFSSGRIRVQLQQVYPLHRAHLQVFLGEFFWTIEA